eukprot:5517844-Pyramimonas_sp.AAC.1
MCDHQISLDVFPPAPHTLQLVFNRVQIRHVVPPKVPLSFDLLGSAEAPMDETLEGLEADAEEVHREPLAVFPRTIVHRHPTHAHEGLDHCASWTYN